MDGRVINPVMAQSPQRLLLVDDELDLLSTLSEILQDCGYAVVSAWDGEGATEIASLYEPDVLITDFTLPGIDGVTTIRNIREQHPHTRAILMSGHISTQTRQRAQCAHVDRVMEKPLSVPQLLDELSLDDE